MKSLLSALLVVALVPSTISAPLFAFSLDNAVADDSQKEPGRLDQLLRTFGMSPCVSSCMFELNTDFVYRDQADQPADLKKVCESYERASECFHTCPEVDQRVFEVTASGIQYMCVEKRAEFERAMPCINEQREPMKKECNQKCARDDPTNTKASHPQQPQQPQQPRNSSDVFNRLSDLCVVLHCSVGCGRDFLNSRCDPEMHAGALTTEVMLRPLQVNAEILDKSPREVREYVTQALPHSCAYTISVKELDALRHGDQGDSERGSTEPQSNEPQSSEPQSSEPQSNEHQSSEPQSNEPENSETSSSSSV